MENKIPNKVYLDMMQAFSKGNSGSLRMGQFFINKFPWLDQEAKKAGFNLFYENNNQQVADFLRQFIDWE